MCHYPQYLGSVILYNHRLSNLITVYNVCVVNTWMKVKGGEGEQAVLNRDSSSRRTGNVARNCFVSFLQMCSHELFCVSSADVHPGPVLCLSADVQPRTVLCLSADVQPGTVLCLSADVRSIHADHAASHLGKAVGIITLIRAVPFHANRGHVYLPIDLMMQVATPSV